MGRTCAHYASQPAQELRNDTTIESFGQTLPKADSEIERQNEWANALEDIANQLPRDAR